MNNIFISFETAKLANEKLFDVPCGDVYNWSGEIENSLDLTGELEFSLDDLQNSQENGHGKCYFCPTQSLLQKWLREKHSIRIVIDEDYDNMLNYLRGWIPKVNRFAYYNGSADCFEVYEDALEKALYESLK